MVVLPVPVGPVKKTMCCFGRDSGDMFRLRRINAFGDEFEGGTSSLMVGCGGTWGRFPRKIRARRVRVVSSNVFARQSTR